MPQATVDQAMQIAVQHHAAGRLADAEKIYRWILAQRPNHPEALKMLGTLAGQAGQWNTAVDLIRLALRLKPDDPVAGYNLGLALMSGGRAEEAIAAYRHAVHLRPDYFDAYNNLGIVLNHLGRREEAVSAYRQAIESKPDFAEAHTNLGIALRALGKLDAAIAAHRQAIRLKPDFTAAHNNLGLALQEIGQVNEAIAAFEQVLALQPDYTAALRELTALLAAEGRFDQVMDIYERTTIRFSAGETPNELPMRQIYPHAKSSSDTVGKVFAVCSIRNGSLDLLPHWLEHYTQLGADRLLLGIFDDLSPSLRDEIARCADRWQFTCFKQSWKGIPEALHAHQRRAGCRLAGAVPETWILHTDLDELHEFPAPLHEIIAAAEAKNIPAVIGWFLDRVSADGSMPPIRPSPSLWEQFPIGCRLTARILRTVTQKIMLARFSVPVHNGHHYPEGAVKLGAVPFGRPEQYIVHHFKWHGDVLARMEWSRSQPNTQPQWKTEANRFLTWLNAGGGRINIDDPAIQARIWRK